jgi:hypothetical protein
VDARREEVTRLFATLGVEYDRTDAELVLQILKRQVVAQGPDGKPVPQPRWIKYGSRVLLSIIEQPPEDRAAILDAIFGPRQAALARLATAGDPAARLRMDKALQAHDYVYDVMPEALEPAI